MLYLFLPPRLFRHSFPSVLDVAIGFIEIVIGGDNLLLSFHN